MACETEQYINLQSSLWADNISVAQYIHWIQGIRLKFYTEHGSITAELCAKFQKD